MVKRIVILSLVCAAAFAVPAEAQLCAGGPAFSTAPLQVGSGLAFQSGMNAVGVGFAGGSDSGFAAVNFGRTNFSDLDVSAKTLAGSFGGQVGSGRVAVCPLGQVGYVWGPNLGLVKANTLNAAGGVRVGVAANDSDTFMVVPTFGMDLIWGRTTVTDVFDNKLTDSGTGGLATVGVGLIFNRVVGIIPSVGIPVAMDSNDVSFGFTVAFNFGR